MNRSIHPALNIAEAATANTWPGKGGGGGADASGPAHPCASDGGPSTSAPPIPPASLPTGHTPVPPHLGGRRSTAQGHRRRPDYRQGGPQVQPPNAKNTHRGAHLPCRRRPAGGTTESRPARPPATSAAPPPPPAEATVGADARSPRRPWPSPAGPRSGQTPPSEPSAHHLRCSPFTPPPTTRGAAASCRRHAAAPPSPEFIGAAIGFLAKNRTNRSNR